MRDATACVVRLRGLTAVLRAYVAQARDVGAGAIVYNVPLEIFHLFRLVRRDERVYDLVHVAVEKIVELIYRQAYAVV